MTAYLPGRLGNSEQTLGTDPRLDPRLRAALEKLGMLDVYTADMPVQASYEECLAFCTAFETADTLGHPAEQAAMPAFDDVESTTQVITGGDGNALTLFIDRPKAYNGMLPAIVHTHGGGMAIMTAADPAFVRWRKSLASAGLLVVGVEFRNAGGKLGNHPFPAGLDDCAAATRWVHANREKLGVSAIVISGESGGGNLAIATTLKAKKEQWLEHIDGVFACCPYISGTYTQPPEDLVSQFENADYMLGAATMGALVKAYDPPGANASNPLAWPMWANITDLKGLPPHIISVNELDPLRDEGLVYFRKLMAAGVSVSARTVHGTPHAGDLMFPDINPEVYADSLRSVVAFARSLAKVSA